MALDSPDPATNISELNASLPAAGDSRTEGDNHIRSVKNAVKTTFANITGAVTSTHTELNYLDGSTPGTAVPSTALVVDSNKDITLGTGDITATNATFTGTSTITTADINGGAIDGTTIGASSAAAGTFSTLTGTVVTCSTSLGLASGTTVNDIDTAMAASPTDNQLLTAQGIKEFCTISERTGVVPTAKATQRTIAHAGAGTKPVLINVTLRCTSADAGYASGDEINLPQRNDQNSSNLTGMNWYFDATNVYVVAGNDNNYNTVVNPSTGIYVAADFATPKWVVVVRAWNQ